MNNAFINEERKEEPKMVLLKTKQLAERVGQSERYWEMARIKGDGPAFIKIGRSVYYKLEDVEAWLESNKRKSTSEVKNEY